MKIPFLNLDYQHRPIAQEMLQVTADVIKKGWFIGGERVHEFEQAFADYLGGVHCVGCGNGTDALELVLRAFGIGNGDEVIIPSFTWVSDVEAVVAVGATPVYADLPENGYAITAETISPLISDRTRAIIVVHLYGIPVDLDPILKLAKERNIKVIEDCAQAHGATYRGKKVGTLGDAGTFSFYPTKNLGALGDGGAVVTRDEQVAENIRLMTNHGQKERDIHLSIGRNSRLDPLQAAYLTLKLSHLDEWNEKRKQLAELYTEGLQTVNMTLPGFTDESIVHLFVIQSSQRDKLRDYLLKMGIETAIHYPKPIHKLKPYEVEGLTLAYSEHVARRVLSLPLYPGLEVKALEYIVDCLKRF